MLEDFINEISNIPRKENDTLLTIIGKTWDECTCTKWLSYLLDPKVNGIGMGVINSLLQAANLNEINKDENVHVHAEYQIKDRRIDILIEVPQKRVITIENKVSSWEHNGQTSDYEKYCEGRFKNLDIDLIYLKPDWNNSIPDNTKFKIIKYSEFHNKLKENINEHQLNEINLNSR